MKLNIISKLIFTGNKSLFAKVMDAKHPEPRAPRERAAAEGGVRVRVLSVGDLYIRDDRQTEYQYVLAGAIRAIAAIKPDLIIIMGNIFGTKGSTKGKYDVGALSAVCDFLRHIGRIAPVRIVAGKYDVKGKMELVGPMLQYARDMGPVEYYKISDNYLFDLEDGRKINITVKSVLDKISVADLVESHSFKDDSKVTKIFISTDENLGIGNLAEMYDIVMLGGKNDYTQVTDNCAYPGALYQQSADENANKGFILWDLKEKKHTFIPVLNNHGWARVRDVDNFDPGEKKIFHVLTLDNSLLKFKIKKESIEEKYDIEIKRLEFAEFLHTEKEMEKEMEKEIKSRGDIIWESIRNSYAPDLAEKVITFHEKIYDQREEELGSGKYELVEMRWGNMFCYGPNNVIVFENGISGIIAENRSGKSSVIDMIIYVLYNKVMRGHVADLIRQGQEMGWIDITILICNPIINHKMRIKRTCAKKPLIEIWIDDVPQPVRGVMESYQFIRGEIGTFEDMQRTCLITQEDRVAGDFVWCNKKDRYKILGAFFNLDDLVAGGEKVRVERDAIIKDFARNLGITGARVVNAHLLVEINDKLAENAATLAVAAEENARARKEIEDTESAVIGVAAKIEDWERRIEEHNRSIVRVDKTGLAKHGLVGKTMAQLAEIRAERLTVDISTEEEILQEKIKILQEKISNLKPLQDLDAMLKEAQRWEAWKKKYAEYTDDLTQLLDELSRLRSKDVSMPTLQPQKRPGINLSYNHDCEDCRKNRTTYETYSYETAQEYGQQMAEYSRKKEEYIETTSQIQKLSNRIKVITARDAEKPKEVAFSSSFSSIELKRLIVEHESLVNELNQQSIKYNELTYHRDTRNELTTLFLAMDEQIRGLRENATMKTQLTSLRAEHTRLQNVIATHRAYIAANEARVSKIDEINRRAHQSMEYYTIATSYVDCMNIKSGIPGQLMRSYLHNLVGDTNVVLDAAGAGFHIYHVEDDGVEMMLKSENSYVPLELGSGYQKFIVSIAMRVGMARLFPRPIGNFMIVDEGFACADEANLKKIADFLDKIKKNFKFILIITHLEILQDSIEFPIKIEIAGGCSSINHL